MKDWSGSLDDLPQPPIYVKVLEVDARRLTRSLYRQLPMETILGSGVVTWPEMEEIGKPLGRISFCPDKKCLPVSSHFHVLWLIGGSLSNVVVENLAFDVLWEDAYELGDRVKAVLTLRAQEEKRSLVRVLEETGGYVRHVDGGPVGFLRMGGLLAQFPMEPVSGDTSVVTREEAEQELAKATKDFQRRVDRWKVLYARCKALDQIFII